MIAPKWVRVPTNTTQIIESGEPIYVHGVVTTNETNNDLCTFANTTTGDTYFIVNSQGVANKTLVVSIPFKADGGLTVTTSSDALAEATIFYSGPGM
ncbi:MAG: hypothetical protein ACXABY_05395 [Candidatus Thorarchaeota archaeon]|jgi:hypothetical protein